MAYTLQQLSDLQQIRDATFRYCRGVDRLDEELMKSAYWPEAVDHHGNFVGNAHEFSAYCMPAHRRWRWTMHSVYNHTIELDDDGIHGRGELYNITSMARADTGAIDTWYGRYLDAYEKRGDEWRIIDRVCVHHGTQTVTDPVPMEITTTTFRQNDFDRPSSGRRVGP